MVKSFVAFLTAAWMGLAVAAEQRAPADGEAARPDAAPKTDTAAAADAVRSWLALVDEGRYAESWMAAAEIFRKAVSEEEWVRQAGAFRAPLGKVVQREILGAKPMTSLPGAPNGEYVVFQYETTFEHKKAAVETITPMRDADGRWRVSGYYVR